jgi:hypothetical protein
MECVDMKTFDMRERRTTAETDARRSRKAQIDRVRRRLGDITESSVEGAKLKNIMKAIVDIMEDDGGDE